MSSIRFAKPSILAEVHDLVEQGKIRPVIDKRYPLAATANAHRYVESGRKRGNVVVEIAEADAH